MSGSRRKSDGGGRSITPDEEELWRHATRTLERVKGKPRVPAAGEPAADRPPATGAAPMLRAPKPAPQPAGDRPRPVRADPAPLPPIAAFERRKARQIAAGKDEIGARVDLHGLRQADARARLRTFLFEAYARGHRTVLVITGKGGSAPVDPLGGLAGERQRGVIKRNVPDWLAEADLRGIVLSFREAGVRHGGAGALYVQLRKAR